MIFKKLILENFRVYYGRTEVDLYNSNNGFSKENLVLFGGLNGAGKTSLLTAFSIVLFGNHVVGEKDYKVLLNNALNNKFFSEGGREALIELHLKDKEFFKIRLKLFFNHNQEFTHHERTLLFDNRKIHLTETEFIKYINKKIPLKVAPFFIFDGEKIQDLVEKQENGDLKKAIQNVISLDFYKSMLSHIIQANQLIRERTRKIVSQYEVNSAKELLDTNQREKEDLLKRVSNYDEKIKTLEMEREALKKLRMDKIIASSGSKQELTKIISQNQKELEIIKKRIEEEKSKLPIYLVTNLINQLKNRLSLEQKKINLLRNQKLQYKQFDQFIEELMNRLKNYDLDNFIMEKLYKEAKEVWTRLYDIHVQEVPDIDILFDLNQSDLSRILQYRPENISNIQKLIEKKYKLEEQTEKLVEEQKNAPDSLDVTKEELLIDELSLEIGSLVTKRRSVEIKLRKINEEILKLEKKYKSMLENATKSNDLIKLMKFSDQVENLMNTFIERVTKYKAQQVADEFSYIIGKIFRKEQDFKKIEFDTEDFVIKIYNEQNRLIRLANRSAGEKQLIALALIWSLTKSANMSIPFVIDTPLGRLDSVHRENLSKYYFPHLSEQVIILSTDTEVNDKYLEPLKESILLNYKLEYNRQEKFTIIEKGYF